MNSGDESGILLAHFPGLSSVEGANCSLNKHAKDPLNLLIVGCVLWPSESKIT